MSSLRTSKRKRLSDTPDPVIGWSCPACTFNNPTSAFKCQICETRKGTSTRISSTVDVCALEVQRTIQEQIDKQKKQGSQRRSDSATGLSSDGRRQHSKSDDESNSGLWALSGDSESTSSSTSSSSPSSARIVSSSLSERVEKAGSKPSSNRYRVRRQLSSSPSPSPQPHHRNSTSSPSSSLKTKPTSKSLKSSGDKKCSLIDDADIPSSSASSCNVTDGKAKQNGKVNAKAAVVLPKCWPRLANVNRNSARSTEVTVHGVTVIFTDYEPL